MVIVVLRLTNSSVEAGGTGVGSVLGCSSYRWDVMMRRREKDERNRQRREEYIAKWGTGSERSEPYLRKRSRNLVLAWWCWWCESGKARWHRVVTGIIDHASGVGPYQVYLQ